MAEETTLLVVDDDPASAGYLSLALRQAGYSVRTARGGAVALVAMERELPSVVFSDLYMSDMGGLELLTHVRERWPGVAVVLFSVEDDVATIVEAVRRGAVNYLVKPIAPAVLLDAAAKAVARVGRDLTAQPERSLPEIVGVSPPIVQVRRTVELAARSDVNVLVVGETGTGKELVARAVHRISSLTAGPFVAHNCAVTSPEMFDSEFFGHRRGAFTGADRDRAGIFREADRGVLFLDELECLSLANQAKLLRVLDDGRVRPVGSEVARPVSIRFVAATNRAPEEMLDARELREDLYYRLRGFQIDLPPLRERIEDIPHLARHFLESVEDRITPRALEALARAPWPGNVRQLRNVLRSASAAAGAEVIDVHHLLAVGHSHRSLLRSPSEGRADTAAGTTLEAAEKRAISDALEACGGNLSRTAAALGIHRSTLRRKLKDLNLKHRRTRS